jgi:hypothetical protein
MARAIGDGRRGDARRVRLATRRNEFVFRRSRRPCRGACYAGNLADVLSASAAPLAGLHERGPKRRAAARPIIAKPCARRAGFGSVFENRRRVTGSGGLLAAREGETGQGCKTGGDECKRNGDTHDELHNVGLAKTRLSAPREAPRRFDFGSTSESEATRTAAPRLPHMNARGAATTPLAIMSEATRINARIPADRLVVEIAEREGAGGA